MLGAPAPVRSKPQHGVSGAARRQQRSSPAKGLLTDRLFVKLMVEAPAVERPCESTKAPGSQEPYTPLWAEGCTQKSSCTTDCLLLAVPPHCLKSRVQHASCPGHLHVQAGGLPAQPNASHDACYSLALPALAAAALNTSFPSSLLSLQSAVCFWYCMEH